jgi:anti-anti-sigma factor
MRLPVTKTVVRFLRHSDDQLVNLARRLPPGGELHLDLRGVDHLGSAALGTLVTLSRRLACTGKSLVLNNLDPALYRLLDLTRLTAVLESRCEAAPAAVSLAPAATRCT